MNIQQAALAIVRRLREHGHEALFAGGCVRDMLLKIEPKDFDIATSARPEEIVALFTRTKQVGAQFGVVMIGQSRHWIETATFRTDLDYQDGRRPEHVAFTTATEDARRRDFTINGLFYNPIAEKVIDYVDGQADLDAGVIRAIGDPAQRFAEDHLRMLRAVRFAARLDFKIEKDTAAAIKAHAERMVRISAERIREELQRILTHHSRPRGVRLLRELDLIEHLGIGDAWPADRVEDAANVIGRLPKVTDFVTSLAGLLHDCSATEVKQIARTLRCSNEQVGDLAWLLTHLHDPERAKTLSLADIKRLLVHARVNDLLKLHHAVRDTHGLSLDGYHEFITRRNAVAPKDIAPPPLVTGDDLLALGYEPGPIFKQVLDNLYDAQLNEAIVSKSEALRRLSELTGIQSADQKSR